VETEIRINAKLEAYIKYIKFEQKLNDRFDLDQTQIQVLNELAFTLNTGKLLRVGEILDIRYIASPATIHAALKKLVAKDLVQIIVTNENRIKLIELTPSGHERLKNLANALSK
jgi:DNA-binding MarR family transcriptional regulator